MRAVAARSPRPRGPSPTHSPRAGVAPASRSRRRTAGAGGPSAARAGEGSCLRSRGWRERTLLGRTRRGWCRPERRLLEPPARESGALQALAHVRVAVHDSPHQRRTIVLDHRQYRSLIDADVVLVNPARERRLWWALRPGEAGVERVQEPVRGVDRGAEAVVHLERCGQHDLGGKGERADGGGWGDGAVVDDAAQGHAARGVPQEAAIPAQIRLARRSGAIGSAHAPHVLAVSLELLRIRDGVPALRVGGPAAVLEVVESMLAHVRILDAAEIHPYVRVLVAKEGREAQVGLVVERAPELVVRAAPLRMSMK